MNRTNIDQYHSSLAVVKSMFVKGLIDEKDYKKAESHLAKKYCIKKGSLYRSNDLINNPFRVIYIVQKKEVQNARENDNKNRCVTTIRKET